MLLIQGSPHVGGVGDGVAEVVSRSVAEAEVLTVRDFRIHHCDGCNSCAETGRCKFAARGNDQAQALLGAIMDAPALLLVAPIYFYALPGHLKCLIDRSQPLWHLPRRQHAKRAGAILVAGRQRGEQLFCGALLTLKYFFHLMGFNLTSQLCLLGLESRASLDSRPHYTARIQTFAAEFYTQC